MQTVTETDYCTWWAWAHQNHPSCLCASSDHLCLNSVAWLRIMHHWDNVCLARWQMNQNFVSLLLSLILSLSVFPPEIIWLWLSCLILVSDLIYDCLDSDDPGLASYGEGSLCMCVCVLTQSSACSFEHLCQRTIIVVLFLPAVHTQAFAFYTCTFSRSWLQSLIFWNSDLWYCVCGIFPVVSMIKDLFCFEQLY